jgi:3-isopropylmalate/(R)-2-methylmalate dehydratase small subunit
MTDPVSRIEGRAYRLGLSNIDTDLIIPADHLKTTSRQGLGEHLFASIRSKPGNMFDDPSLSGAPILVAGENFGCGSSREHAVWALMDFGIRAVIASSFSDIFAGNAFKNGLLAARVDPLAIVCLLQLPGTAKIRIDLGAQSIEAPKMPAIRFDIDPFQRECLMRGVDEIELTLGLEEEIRRYEMLVSSGQGGMSLA